MRRIYSGVFVGTLVAAALAACGSDVASKFGNGSGGDGGGVDGSGPGSLGFGEGGTDEGGIGQPIVIEPTDQVVTFTTGQPAPTVQFTAKTVATGETVPASFTIDRGEIGAVDLTSGLFTAGGAVGGKATITASWRGTQATTSVSVKLVITQNGAGPLPDAGTGAGGNGGVGGDGPGGTVPPETGTVLQGTPTSDGLAMLYPYEGTVWPRGILAPLLMWQPGSQGDYDAVRIHIEETNFVYDGVFAANAHPFKNHPVPQDVWNQLTSSNAGEDVNVTLTFAKGTTAYGPPTFHWKVASAPLKGVVYYNSYGTRLAKNATNALGGDGKFGGATLAIRGGSTDPVLVAGGNGGTDQCRVCHSVSANGQTLITQRDDGSLRLFSSYDLKAPTETFMAPTGGDGSSPDNYAWSAIYPDGSMFLGDSSNVIGSSALQNQLYSVVSGANGGTVGPNGTTPNALPMNNWPSGFRAAFPAFSPDGKNLAFTMYGGATGADTRTLGMMTYDKTSSTFGNIQTLYLPSQATSTAVYPAFLPTNDAMVFHLEVQSNGRDYGGTRSLKDSSDPQYADTGARAELWWVNVPKAGENPVAARLDKLNGVGYLPTGPNKHDADATLNYEPTVNPVPSGGYAWVVFTSRRMYGNVATINPYHSDPRYFDLTSTPTTKKLWVAAIDLNAAPGTDPSHPAFYLPAQELLAGNARGYWVVDPCSNDGSDCTSGDECCGGYCRPNTGGKLVCSNVVPQCAQEYEKCTTTSDCCNSAAFECINGRCAAPLPK